MSSVKDILYKFGCPEDKTEEVFKVLSKSSSILGIPVDDLAYMYGSMFISGNVSEFDLKHLNYVGIPILNELKELNKYPEISFKQTLNKFNLNDVDTALKNFVEKYA